MIINVAKASLGGSYYGWLKPTVIKNLVQAGTKIIFSYNHWLKTIAKKNIVKVEAKYCFGYLYWLKPPSKNFIEAEAKIKYL